MTRTSLLLGLSLFATACSAPASSETETASEANAVTGVGVPHGTFAGITLTEADADELVEARAGVPLDIILDTNANGYGWYVESADAALGRPDIRVIGGDAPPHNARTSIAWFTGNAVGYHQIVLEYRLGGERPAAKTLSFFVHVTA